MAGSNAADLLRRVAHAGGVLLRVERLRAPGAQAAALLLTFDAGRVLLTAQADAPGLAALVLEKPDDVSGGLEDASEREPWWRVLGNPLVGVETRGSEDDAVRLQFRPSDQSPRFVVVSARGASVGVALEPA